MLASKKLISLLLALMLAAGNVAFSAHVSSHISKDTGLCSLCIHPGSPDTVSIYETSALFVISSRQPLKLGLYLIHLLPVILHIQQSRAPPILD